jgi:L-lactate dehydrogenase complex protein LldG
MTAARDRILGAVRDALVRAVLPDASEDAPRQPPPPPVDAAALWRQFEEVLTALTGRVHRAATVEAAADVVVAVAAEHGARSFISWDGHEMGCPGLLDALAARGLPRVTYDLAFDAARRAADVPALGDVILGVTGSDAAVADAGAIVLASGSGRGRLASLLPPVHIAIVSASRIWPTLPALFADEPALVGRGANLVVIAGPSRTADIEMTLTHGVHGPKHLHVILVP